MEALTKTTIKLSKNDASVENRCRKEELGDNFGLDRINDPDVRFGMV